MGEGWKTEERAACSQNGTRMKEREAVEQEGYA